MTQFAAGEIERRSASAVLNRIAAFDGGPQQFLTELIAAQCELVGAGGGALLRRDGEGRVRVAVMHPALERGGALPDWLKQAADFAAAQPGLDESAARAVTRSDALYGQPVNEHIVLQPVRDQADQQGVAAFYLRTSNERDLEEAQRELALSASLLTLYQTRVTLQQRQAALRSLSTAMEVLAATNEQHRFKAAAMGLCNELAARWGAERVSVGLLRGQYIQLQAMSQTEDVSRRMKLIQDLESAMEECLDQDVELLAPAPNEATYIHRATADYARAHGAAALCSLPLRHRGGVVGVITLERSAGPPFTADQVQFLRLACDLCTPRLIERAEQDRWFGARLAALTRRGFAALVGPRHTWAKVAAIGLLAAVLFLTLVDGPYRVEASFVIQATEQRVIPAPFEGYLDEVHVRPGDRVEAGKTVLASLETSQLRLERARLIAERDMHLKEADVARDEGTPGEVQIAMAKADRAQAQLDWVEHQISQAQVRSPISGTVIAGDLVEEQGAPTSKGRELFRVAPLDRMRAVLHVPDDRIAEFETGQRGALATAAHPGRYLAFEVESIEPVAEVIDQINVFRVYVKLDDPPPWLRPGMEGVAKVDAGRASYGWIWTHDAVDWVRMKLWL